MKKCVAFSAFYSHFLVYSLAAKKKIAGHLMKRMKCLTFSKKIQWTDRQKKLHWSKIQKESFLKKKIHTTHVAWLMCSKRDKNVHSKNIRYAKNQMWPIWCVLCVTNITRHCNCGRKKLWWKRKNVTHGYTKKWIIRMQFCVVLGTLLVFWLGTKKLVCSTPALLARAELNGKIFYYECEMNI